MATSAAAAVAIARKKIAGYFLAMHAISAQDAVAYKPERMIRARQFEKMRAKGVIREAEPGKYWLDLPAYEADREARRRLALVIIFFALLAAAAIPLFFYQG